MEGRIAMRTAILRRIWMWRILSWLVSGIGIDLDRIAKEELARRFRHQRVLVLDAAVQIICGEGAAGVFVLSRRLRLAFAFINSVISAVGQRISTAC